MIWIIAATAVLIALAIAPGHLLYFDVTPKTAVLLLGVAIALAVGRSRKLVFWKTPGLERLFYGLLAAQAVSLCVSTALSVHVGLSLGGTNWRRFGLLPQLALVIFAALAARTFSAQPDKIRIVLRAVAVGCLLSGAYGMLQYAQLDPWLAAYGMPPGQYGQPILRPAGTLGHPVYFANYLAAAVFLSAALARSGDRRFWRILGWTAAAVGVVALLLTGTRAGWLGAATGAGLWFFWRRPSVTPRRVGAAALLLAGLSAFILSPPGAMLRNRIIQARGDALGGIRLWVWRDTAAMALRRPLAGFGLETFGAAFPRYQSVGFANAYPEPYSESPHNVWLDAAVSQGLPGAVLLAGLFALGVVLARRARDPVQGAALLAALAAQAVCGLFASFTLPTALYFYLTLALLAAAALPAGDAAHGTLKLSPAAAASQGAKLLLAALFALSAVQLWLAGYQMARVRDHLARQDLTAAMSAYRRALAVEPPGYSSDLWYSRNLELAAQAAGRLPEVLDEARDAGLRAVARAEDPHNAFYQLAITYSARGQLDLAEQALRDSIRVAPHWYKPHLVLAQMLLAKQEQAAALAEMRTAVSLNPADPGLQQTLERMQAPAAP